MQPTVRILSRLAFCCLAFVAGGVLAGCPRDDPGGVLGRPPTTAVIHLSERDAVVIRGDDAGPRSSDRLLALDADALSHWTRTRVDGALRFESPRLGPRGIAGAGSLRVRLVPGGATHLAVVPHARGTRAAREERALRRIELSLERDAAPDAPAEISVDLFEALHANLGDAGRSGRLEKLELILPDADPEHASLESLILERRTPLPPGLAAAWRIADHGGVLRPSWVVAGGTAVEIAVTLPPGAPELRWTDAAAADTGARTVTLVDGETQFSLAETEPAPGALGAPWTPRSVALSRFAGRSVRIRLAVEDAGVGLFGSPTVVAGQDAVSPDVLLYLIDTLRGDHLGFATPGRPPVSPTLDRLAREGVWFRRAQSSSPWTKPAVATLFSGVLPTTHRVGASSYTDRMPESVPLVQEAFRAAGWRTASFSASPLGSTLSALERGFDAAWPPRYWRARARLGMNPAAGQLHDALLGWTREQPDRPFFAYVHTLEVHEWKLPRYQDERPEGFSAYDASILDADRQLGELLAELEAEPRQRDLLVVVVSDHGESWGDHGLPSHGFGLHQSQIHVPLVLWRSGAGLPPRVVDTPVSLADLAPTLLEGFGLDPLEAVDGQPLGALIAGDELDRGPVLSALLRFVWAPRAPKQYAITTADQVVRIRNEGGPDRSYDLAIDPQETRPLPEPAPELDGVLDELLRIQAERAERFRDRHGPVVPGAVTADESARLRALGYLASPDPERPTASKEAETPHGP